MPISTEFQAEIGKKSPQKRAPLEDSGPNLPTYLGLVFGTFFFDAACHFMKECVGFAFRPWKLLHVLVKAETDTHATIYK